MSSQYHEVYARWKGDPDAFWAEAAREIDWYRTWDRVFDPYAGQYGRWFTGAECNTAWNCLDRHVEGGRAQQRALIYDSPVTNASRAFTYAELRDEVATLAGVLRDFGVAKGDRVIIYMPMVPEAVMACSHARASAPSTPSCSAALPHPSSQRALRMPSPLRYSPHRAASSRDASCSTSR